MRSILIETFLLANLCVSAHQIDEKTARLTRRSHDTDSEKYPTQLGKALPNEEPQVVQRPKNPRRKSVRFSDDQVQKYEVAEGNHLRPMPSKEDRIRQRKQSPPPKLLRSAEQIQRDPQIEIEKQDQVSNGDADGLKRRSAQEHFNPFMDPKMLEELEGPDTLKKYHPDNQKPGADNQKPGADDQRPEAKSVQTETSQVAKQSEESASPKHMQHAAAAPAPAPAAEPKTDHTPAMPTLQEEKSGDLHVLGQQGSQNLELTHAGSGALGHAETGTHETDESAHEKQQHDLAHTPSTASTTSSKAAGQQEEEAATPKAASRPFLKRMRETLGGGLSRGKRAKKARGQQQQPDSKLQSGSGGSSRLLDTASSLHRTSSMATDGGSSSSSEEAPASPRAKSLKRTSLFSGLGKRKRRPGSDDGLDAAPSAKRLTSKRSKGDGSATSKLGKAAQKTTQVNEGAGMTMGTKGKKPLSWSRTGARTRFGLKRKTTAKLSPEEAARQQEARAYRRRFQKKHIKHRMQNPFNRMHFDESGLA